MGKCRKNIGLVLLFVYAFFFASTNFFYHSHQLADHRLVHSHPFSGANHSHTANQIVLIQAADSSNYQESSILTVPDYILEQLGDVGSQLYVRPALPPDNFSFSLRAPPTTC